MSLSKKTTLTIKDYSITLSSPLKFYKNDTLDLVFNINEYGIEIKNGISTFGLMPINALNAKLLIECDGGKDFIEATAIVDNTITFRLDSKYSQYQGVGKMQIVLLDNDGCKITLPEFDYEIKESINANWDSNIQVVMKIISTENGKALTDERGNLMELIKLSELPEASSLTDTDYVMITQNGESKKVKTNLFKGTVEIVNDLTTGGIDKALSAEQGKVIKLQLETIVQSQVTDLSLSGTTLKLKKADGTVVGTGITLPTSNDGSVTDKFIDWYNVKDYGAIGDGITDDRNAIQSAIDDCFNNGGGTVYLPKGEYILKSYLEWKSNVNLIGVGVGKSILKTKSDTEVLGFSAIEWNRSMYNESNPISNCTFRDFEIDGSGLSVSVVSWRGKGIFLIGVRDCYFENLIIRETCATGLGIDALYNVSINNVYCINCGRTWVKPQTEENLGCAGIGIGTNMGDGEYFTITNCITLGCGNMGIFLEDQTLKPFYKQTSIIANNIVLNGKNVGIGVRGVQNMNIFNNHIEGNVYGIEFSRKNENINIKGNTIIKNQYGIYNNSVTDTSIDIEDNKIENNTICGIKYVNTTTLGTIKKQDTVLKGNHLKSNILGMDFTGNIADLSIVDNFIEKHNKGINVNSNTVFTDGVVLRNIFKGNTTNYVNLSESLAGDIQQDLYSNIAELTGIKFDSENYTVSIGSNITLNVLPIPSNAMLGEVTWEADNGNVSVNNGIITGNVEGSSVVTATCGEFTASCNIKIMGSSSIIMDGLTHSFSASGFSNNEITSSINPLDKFTTIGSVSKNGDVLEFRNSSYADSNINLWSSGVSDTTIEFKYKYLDTPTKNNTLLSNITNDYITSGVGVAVHSLYNIKIGSMMYSYSNGTTPYNDTHHVFIVIDNQNSVSKIYIDNVLVDTSTTFDTSGVKSSLVLGGHKVTSGSTDYEKITTNFDFSLLRIYNRCLSESEISQNYLNS